MVRDVKDRQSHTSLIFLAAKRNRHAFRYEDVEGYEWRKPSAFVAWSNKVLILIYPGEGKPAAPFNDRRRHEIPGQSNITPCEQAVRYVETLWPIFIRTNDGIPEIAKIQIEVVQVSTGFRLHVRNVNISLFLQAPTRDHLKFPVNRTAGIVQK